MSAKNYKLSVRKFNYKQFTNGFKTARLLIQVS